MDKKKKGLLIKDLRLKKNMKQIDLAKAIGITSASLSAYEQGATNPSTENLAALAKFFEVPIEYFNSNEPEEILKTESWKDQMIEEVRAIKEKMQEEINFLREQLREKDTTIHELTAILGKQ
ncbi:DNA-binding transcriptional regulator, XRE-family HTH domain [Flexibacter flexilis DSM 6793]|uniref:DNA-binding transcriptional regulator, XRE-family HTH domain n=1 Tax=Flexibacter flexilis DSM 6793 TaxID=927664 RepID=A0A1I1LCT5_9BACT|nr:helix-turn-helix transcriptional regulator [Flexibacter flexilis]SFC70785.1 DNA-binding transcriptional regulator, XRE-family HTH domain [Flexibacter flexilis DSM 6793]